MPIDHSLDLRRAVTTALSQNAGLSVMVGGRIYGERQPATVEWPFIRCGLMIAGPYEASKLDGTDATFAVHTFSKAPDASEAYALNAVVQSILDGAGLDVGDNAHVVALDWQSSDVVRDTAEAGAWHGIVQFEAQTSVNF